MSVAEYRYQRVTHEQIEKCIRWCLNSFQLRDWTVALATGGRPKYVSEEEEKTLLGKAYIGTEVLMADIWINLRLAKKLDVNPLSTTIHEVLHILLLERADDVPEQCVMVLEPLLYKLYCQENHLKIREAK